MTRTNGSVRSTAKNLRGGEHSTSPKRKRIRFSSMRHIDPDDPLPVLNTRSRTNLASPGVLPGSIFSAAKAAQKHVRSELKEESAAFKLKALFHFEKGQARSGRRTSAANFLATAQTLFEHGGSKRQLLASCDRGRRALQKCLTKLVEAELRSSKKSELVLVTIILPESHASDEDTIVDWDAYKRKSVRLLSKLGSNYVACIEVQAMCNERHEQGGKVLCIHVHAFFFGKEIYRSAKKAAKALNKRLGKQRYGVDAVHVTPPAKSNESITRMCAYPFRFKPKSKTLYRNMETGRQNLHESEKGDRFIRYERLLEILSALRFSDLVFAGGRGRPIKTAALHSAVQAVRNLPPPPSREAVATFWMRWREHTKTERFKPVVIDCERRKKGKSGKR
jgi:hypothetical protein